MPLFYNDIHPSPHFIPLGSYIFTLQSIETFHKEYDPMPLFFHTFYYGKKACKKKTASAWHILSIWLHKLCDTHKDIVDNLYGKTQTPYPELTGPSPGMNNIQWKCPVFAGNHIVFSQRIVHKRLLNTQKDFGIIKTDNWAINETGQCVLRFQSHVFLKVRTHNLQHS